MAAALVDAGFTRVAASPHAGEGPGGDVSADAASLAREKLQQTLHQQGIGLELLANAEHHLSAAMLDRAARDEVVPIGGTGHWLLVELPWQQLADAPAALFRLQSAGYRLLLAHPERHSYLALDTVADLVDRGVRIQLELGSFLGQYGRQAANRAEMLVERSQAHVMATDLHTTKSAQQLPKMLARVASLFGSELLQQATQSNPEAILNDSEPYEVGALVV